MSGRVISFQHIYSYNEGNNSKLPVTHDSHRKSVILCWQKELWISSWVYSMRLFQINYLVLYYLQNQRNQLPRSELRWNEAKLANSVKSAITNDAKCEHSAKAVKSAEWVVTFSALPQSAKGHVDAKISNYATWVRSVAHLALSPGIDSGLVSYGHCKKNWPQRKS